MAVTGKQLQEAERRLFDQRSDYEASGIPMMVSPKALILTIQGEEKKVIGASQQIQTRIKEVCEAKAPLLPFSTEHSGRLQIFAPTLHFDFEEAETGLIRLLAENIANQRRVHLSDFGLQDTYADKWTKGPMDIPVDWTSCLLAHVRSTAIGENPLLNPIKTGFRISDGKEGTTIFNNHSSLVDPRLTRTSLLHLLGHIVVNVALQTRRPVDIQFTSKDQA